jgi:WD40 repeat protein
MFVRLMTSLITVLMAIPAYGQLVHELTPETWFNGRTNNYDSIKVIGDQVVVVGQTQIDAWTLSSGVRAWQITARDNSEESWIVPGSIWATPEGIKFLESTRYSTIIRNFDSDRTEQSSKVLDLPDFQIACVAWSEDGKQLAIAGSREDGNRNYKLELLIVEGEEIRKCENPKSDVTKLLFTPDGKHLVLAHKQGLNCVNVVDATNGKLLRSSGAFVGSVNALAIPTDCQTIVVTGSANDTNGVIFLDFHTLRPRESGHLTSLQLVNDQHADFLNACFFAGDRFCAFSTEHTGIIIIDVESRTKVAELKGITYPTALAVSADAEWLVSVHSNSTVSVWRWRDVLKELGPTKTIKSHFLGDRSPQLTFSPTENLLAVTCAREAKSENYADSASAAGRSRDDLGISPTGERQPVVVVLIDATTGEFRGTLATNKYSHLNLPKKATEQVENVGMLFKLKISQDGQRLAASSDKGHIFIWDLITKQLEHLDNSSEYPTDLVFEPNGQYLWSVGYRNLLRFDSRQQWELKTFEDVRGSSIALSRDGANLLAGLVAYSKTDLKKVFQAPDSYVDNFLGLTCSPDGRFAFAFLDDKLVRWNLETGMTDMPFVFHRNTTGVKILDCALSPNGKILATSTDDSRIRFWSTDNSELVITLVGHVGPANSIEFSPDGRTLASAGVDGTTRLWSVEPFTNLENAEAARVTPRKLPTNVSYKLENGAIVKVVFDRPAEQAEIEAALIEALNQLRKDTKK